MKVSYGADIHLTVLKAPQFSSLLNRAGVGREGGQPAIINVLHQSLADDLILCF